MSDVLALIGVNGNLLFGFFWMDDFIWLHVLKNEGLFFWLFSDAENQAISWLIVKIDDLIHNLP
jgi:hypothetical protein